MPHTVSTRLLVETVEGITVVYFTDAMILSDDVIHEVDEQLAGLSDGMRPENVLLNFREVQALSSMMLSVLLKLSRKIARAGGRLKFCCIAPNLREIFRVSGFDRLFEIHAEEWHALEAF